MAKRTVCWFSCGAASAVATKIAIDEYGDQPLSVFSISLKREHTDNKRFLEDCAKWFGRTVHEIADKKYNADPHEVFIKTGFLVGPYGAACTRILKREVREVTQRPTGMSSALRTKNRNGTTTSLMPTTSTVTLRSFATS